MWCSAECITPWCSLQPKPPVQLKYSETTVNVELALCCLVTINNLMLDYPPTLYSSHLSTQYVWNVPDRFRMDIMCIVCQIFVNLQPLTESGFICCIPKKCNITVLVFCQGHKHLIPVWWSWHVVKLSFTQWCTFGCISQMGVPLKIDFPNVTVFCKSLHLLNICIFFCWFCSHSLSYSRRGQSFDIKLTFLKRVERNKRRHIWLHIWLTSITVMYYACP